MARILVSMKDEFLKTIDINLEPLEIQVYIFKKLNQADSQE